MLFAASDAEIKEFWSAVLRVDSTLEYDVSYTKANVSSHQSLQITAANIDTIPSIS